MAGWSFIRCPTWFQIELKKIQPFSKLNGQLLWRLRCYELITNSRKAGEAHRKDLINSRKREGVREEESKGKW